ncbi:MAG: GH36-type glycosyl hydrolase domain-containing protein [Coriobacteriia bacterium]
MAAQPKPSPMRTDAPEPPLRAELLSAERIATLAHDIAASQQWTAKGLVLRTPLTALVDRASEQLAADNRELAEAARERGGSSPAGEWLLDNYYLIEEQVLLARADLPSGYGAELPRLITDEFRDFPRIYPALLKLIAHTDARLDEDYLVRFVRGYQEVSPLTIGEVWAVPIMLRIGLVENLRRLSHEVIVTTRAEKAADAWAAELVAAAGRAATDASAVPSVLSHLDAETGDLPPIFFVRLVRRLGDLETGGAAINAWLERRLSASGIVLEHVASESQQQQAADQVSIANSITSIRFLDAMEWREFFESVSLVEAELREDPAQTYAVMDFESRDRYRHVVEIVSRRCPRSEPEVATAALELSRKALARDASDDVRGHVGYWLVAEGRPDLERAVRYRPLFRERLHRGPLAHRGLFYWSVFVLMTAVMLGLLGLYARSEDAATWQLVALLALGVVPLSELALVVVNRLIAVAFPPRTLTKLDYRLPIEETHRTLVVVPALLSSLNSTRNIIEHLEVMYLANRDENIGFALLGDLKAAPGPARPDDGDIVETAIRGVSELNARYEIEHGLRPFHLLLRNRQLNVSEGMWMGWERKRGALLELVREMRSGETSFSTKVGEAAFRHSCAYVITLDADTILPRDGARKLVSAIAHPLNSARWKPGEPRVRRGYGLVQPRVSMTLRGSHKSRFAGLYSGPAGIDPYSGAVSDTYQDAFGEGSFTGKGIFEVDVYAGVLEGRFAENSLLSHDLIEGSFLRTALASDIEVLDDYPANYLAAASRMHRWVRGDWQTVPWLGRTVTDTNGRPVGNPLSALHRWKILDNLRRSLVAPFTFLLFLAGWLLLPGATYSWPLIAALIVFFPAYFSLAGSMVFRPRSVSFSSTAHSVLRDFRDDTRRGGLSFVMLPHQAWLMADAIGRALWRMNVSRRHLLEWETAADVEKRAGTTREAFWRVVGPMAGIAAAAVLAEAALSLALGEPGGWIRLVVAIVIAGLWLSGPMLAWWASLPLPLSRPARDISDAERLALRRLARKTWRFFETFVNREGHYLVPDNFQEEPRGEVAMRTSPTNIGLQLTANVTAYDLGYITIAGLTERSAATLSTMAGLERFRGHFYNWYDTATLEPLRPAYVSTVDSGNLAGHLLVLRIALIEASESPLLGPQLIAGARDAALLALEDFIACQGEFEPSRPGRAPREALDSLLRAIEFAEPPKNLAEWAALLRRLAELANDALTALSNYAPEAAAGANVSVSANGLSGANGGFADGGRAPATCSESVGAAVRDIVRTLRAPIALLDAMAPWARLLAEPPADVRTDRLLGPLLENVPSLVGLAEGLGPALEELDRLSVDGVSIDDATANWAAEVSDGIRMARPACIELLARLRLNSDIAREMWEHTDFSMLYDQHRKLFSIGYNLSEGRLDTSYYDLLASECRLASFLAIAKGDVPQEHWFRLGRSLTKVAEGRALVSWSASMFEYLMPLLVMRDYPDTILEETYDTIVRAQIDYGRARGVPWGVSEAAFNAKDAFETYQYQAFGVPGLGLKRGLSEDLVVAPYATILALPIDPHAVIDNLRQFSDQGAEGHFGYFESLDYTPGRVPAGSTRAVVKAYFAHHQGMALLALGNAAVRGRMRERFHSDPLVRSAELLLQERVPSVIQILAPHVEEVEHLRPVHELPPRVARTYRIADTPVPATHLLSNGRYSVMVTNGGGGYSRWHGLAVSRHREDVTRDCWGTFFYVRDVDSGEVFSAPHNPSPKRPDEYGVVFAPEKAEYRRRDGDLETRIEVVVSPEDDVEVRRLTFTNNGRTARHFETTSYFEIALTTQASDQAHKSFSNLFVETEWLPDTDAILFSRRPRSSEEPRIWGVHMVACDQTVCETSFETDRRAFLGRLRGADDPLALESSGPLGGGQGPVLDPCCALRRGIELASNETARLVFVTGIAESRDAAIRLTEKYRDVSRAQRAIDLAWTAAQLELRDLGINPEEATTLERLASRLVLTDPCSPLKIKTAAENGLPISGLWSIGVSGDYPILLVRVEELEHAPLVRQALLAHQYWRHKGLVADLVIVNKRPSGYADDLDDRLRMLVRTGHALQLLDKPGGVFLRRADQMHPDVLTLLISVARATLEGDAGTIEMQLNRHGKRPVPPPAFVPSSAPYSDPALPFSRPTLTFDNGYGGFDSRTGDYVIVLEGSDTTPAPWIDVLASPHFGCTVSEAGVGCTWALNSHENRITTWNNDPVSDGSGEAIFVRDEETGEYWSPTPLPVRTPEPYVIRHGFGRTQFEHDTHGISHRLDWFVPPDDPVRICRLALTNHTRRPRRLSVTQFVEWVLGDSRSHAQQLVVTWFDAERQFLTAHNHLNPDFPGRCAFLASDRPLHSWTGSRAEFVGRNGRPCEPAAMGRQGLGEVSGRYFDNCGALMTVIDLAPGETADVSFLLGQTRTLEEARELVERYRYPATIESAIASCEDFWEELLGSVRVRTPDERLDTMLNGHLLYQATACRLWGRTAAYQSSGAFGFRDQLQDVLALLDVRPDLVRQQIVEASRHQFPEGDVLHWWQPYSGRGVRTRITDDRHWLPLVVAEYIESTGDISVLDERTAFIEGPPVPPESEDLYLQPNVSEHAVTVYEHCVRALETGRPVGAHGLPLIGGADWNDGMNRVGREGRGESVWLAWFLNYVLTRFAPICEMRGEPDRSADYRAWAGRLAATVEATSWDGAWYRRAYFDDGTPLGTHTAQECRIDAIAQAWAAISGAGDNERTALALDSVEGKLVRREDGLVALLAPPFDKTPLDPGYIKGYVPGVRENGGQYTHGALWVVLAHLVRGDGDEAWGLIDLINPIRHSDSRAKADLYAVEPYVVAADVYAAPPHVGRGGWTWYTGSASWFHRVVLHEMLGFHLVAEKGVRTLRIDPCIPKRWAEFDIVYRHETTHYRIHVSNPRGVNRGVAHVTLDGNVVLGHTIPLEDDGAIHEVVVTMLGG